MPEIITNAAALPTQASAIQNGAVESPSSRCRARHGRTGGNKQIVESIECAQCRCALRHGYLSHHYAGKRWPWKGIAQPHQQRGREIQHTTVAGEDGDQAHAEACIAGEQAVPRSNAIRQPSEDRTSEQHGDRKRRKSPSGAMAAMTQKQYQKPGHSRISDITQSQQDTWQQHGRGKPARRSVLVRPRLFVHHENDSQYRNGRDDQEHSHGSHASKHLPDGRADGQTAPNPRREKAERLRASVVRRHVNRPCHRRGHKEAFA